ncbi:MAG TPA: DUF4349 domain-containing protein [Mycobacteriales bacterium]|nr:DUF4349 domain-containing protein [Mycobacteriales bacterium]
MRLGHKARIGLIGTCAVLVALIATAFAVGGSQPNNDAGGSASVGVAARPADSFALRHTSNSGGSVAPEPVVAPGLAAPTTDQAAASEDAVAGVTPSGRTAASAGASSAGGGADLGASRIVKTGNLTIRVPKLSVQDTARALTGLATAQGGYVSGSNASLETASPYAEVVLRIPVAHFQDAITAAEKLGQKVVSLTTSADDVTGKYVDLSAKKHALERTRSTYLTILSRARTIGATLAVQQRIDGVQQQIDQLHGQLKLLGSQSSYSTLTVDVVSDTRAFAAVHQRDGIDKAWHDSWSRFDRGVNAIVGAIGPVVFAVLLLGLVGLIGLGGYRGFRRINQRPHATS